MATLVSAEAIKTKKIVQAGQTACCFAILFALVVTTPSSRSAEPNADAKLENKLVGTWKLVSAKYAGRESTLVEVVTTVKHVTPSQFMWASYDKDGKVTRAAGGDYTLREDVYEETPRYGLSSDFDVVKGKAQTFKWRIEGKKWYHSGKLSNGRPIEEIWERMDKK